MKIQPLNRKGFSLVEVTLALGLTAFCLVVLFGLLPLGFTSNQQASQETEASGILSSVVADLNACPPSAVSGEAVNTLQYDIDVPANPLVQAESLTLYFSGESEHTAELASGSKYRLNITFQPNGTGEKSATLVHLKVSWPAAAAEPVGSIDTIVALDRN